MPQRSMYPAAAGVLSALAAAPAPAFADERDDRIERLEREHVEMRREIADLKAARNLPFDHDAVRAAIDDYLARSGPLAGTWAGPGGVKRPAGRVTLGGYFSTRWLHSEEEGKKPSFVDMRLVPQLHAQITDHIAFNAEIEFEHGGVADFIEGGEIAVEFAELSFRCSDAFTFKAGTLLVPFGAFNLSHDDPLNELSSRPDVARYVVPSAFGLPGIGVEGSIELSEEAVLTYDIALTNGFKDEINSEKGTRDARGLFEEDDNHDKTVFGRVGLVPSVDFVDALTVGVSGAAGGVGEIAEELRGYGFDAAAKSGPWEFKGEYAKFGIERRDKPPPIDAAGNLGPVRGVNGWYAQLLYRFTDPWVRGLPFAEKDASVAVVLRRDVLDTNDRVHGASARDDERAWSFGVNYRPTTNTVVKLEFRCARSGAPDELGDERDLIVVEFATYF